MANNGKLEKARINYGYLLACKEKDNPTPFCRASYLVSNVGDLVKCYGRALRFPADRKLYEAEMKLAIGDILMQCWLLEHEYNIKHLEEDKVVYGEQQQIDKYTPYSVATYHTAIILENLTLGIKEDNLDELELAEHIDLVIWSCQAICNINGWNLDDIEHLGFLHVMERFEQFERRGWE